MQKSIVWMLLLGAVWSTKTVEIQGQERTDTTVAITVPDRSSSHFDAQIISRALSILPGNEPVIAALDIQEYQMEQVREVLHELKKRMGQTAKETSRRSPEDRRAAYHDVFSDVDTELDNILLPHQTKRLKQIAVQSLAVSPVDGSLNLPNLVALPVVQNQLDLSAKQIDEMRELAKSEKERLIREIEELKTRSGQRLLNALTTQQQTQLTELMGEPFDFEGYVPGRGGRFRKASNDH